MKVLCILLSVAFASGFYIDNNGTHEEKIIGGNRVSIEDVPYHASVLWMRLNNICGATIIHESWVITAAHCVHGKSHILVQAGSETSFNVGKVHRVNETIIHENFNPVSKENDIALIKLKKPIEFNNEQHPIQLAKPYDIPREGELMRISGFGRIRDHQNDPHVLKAAYIHVMNPENCKRYYWPQPITHNMFCARNEVDGVGSGDAGGPGVIYGKLYGIISFGNNSTSTLVPGVYTRVHKYYNWIVQKTGIRF